MSFHLRFQLPHFVFFRWLANYYRKQSEEVLAQSVCSNKTHGYLALHASWEKMAAGELSEATSGFSSPIDFFFLVNSNSRNQIMK